jgi:hypothetical protein
MARSGQTAEVVGDVFDRNVGLIIGRVHFRSGRIKDHINTDTLSHSTVPLKIPWIFLKILIGAELGRVDVDADDKTVTPFPAFPHEIEMPFMEVPHGGNKGYDLPLISEGFR